MLFSNTNRFKVIIPLNLLDASLINKNKSFSECL